MHGGPNQEIYDSYVRKIEEAHMWQGILYPGFLFKPQVLNDIQNFKVRPDDIFISTFPKSGTTWTGEIVSLIKSHVNLDWAKSLDISERVIHLETPPNACLKQLEDLPSPRIFGTHLPYHLLPESIRHGSAKVIYVMRNPKDVAVSFYHHHRMAKDLGNFDGSFKDFLTLFSDGKTVGGSWFDHVLGYWEQKEKEILFLKYEDMKKNFREAITRLSSYLEVDLSSQQVDDVCHHCSFEVMRRNEKANRDWIPLFDKSKGNFLRKGVVGDWKNYFGHEEDGFFMTLYRAKMSKYPTLNFEFEPKGNEQQRHVPAVGRRSSSSLSTGDTNSPPPNGSGSNKTNSTVDPANLSWTETQTLYEHMLPTQILIPS